jgi:hypothetical protein
MNKSTFLIVAMLSAMLLTTLHDGKPKGEVLGRVEKL